MHPCRDDYNRVDLSPPGALLPSPVTGVPCPGEVDREGVTAGGRGFCVWMEVPDVEGQVFRELQGTVEEVVEDSE